MSTRQKTLFVLRGLFSKIFQAIFDTESKWKVMVKFVVLYLIIRYIYNKLHRKYYSLPPGPEGVIPAIGTILPALFDPEGFAFKRASKYGEVLCFYEFNKCVIWINDSKIGKEISELVNTHDHDQDIIDSLEAFNLFAANDNTPSYVFVNGKEWEKRRNLMHSKLFRLLNAQYIAQVINECMINELKPELDEVVDRDNGLWYPQQGLNTVTYGILIRACFGMSIKLNNNDIWTELMNDIIDVLSFKGEIASRTLVLLLFPKFAPMILPKSFFQPIYDLRERIHQNIKTLKDDKTYQQHDIYKSYTASLKSWKDNEKLNFTESQEIADIYLMLYGGVDTTATSVEWRLITLSRQYDIQDKIRNELQTVLKKNQIDYTNKMGAINLTFTIELLQQLPLFRAAIHEIIRITSPTRFGMAHQISNHDIWVETSDNKKYRLPKGARLMYNIHYINYNNKTGTVEHWKNIDQDPQMIYLNNWLNNQNEFVINPSFYAFNQGKRNCPGKELALKEIRVVLAYLLLNYKFSLPETLKNMKHISWKGGVIFGIAKPVPEIPLIVKII